MEQSLQKLAVKQWGLFTRAQALEAGVHRRTIVRRVAEATWHRFEKGVYRFPGGTDSWHQKVMAATLALGEGAVASHRTAAYLWGIELRGGPPLVREVTSPRNARTRVTWAKLHRTMRPPTAVMRSGIPTTPLARTMVDLADVLDDEQLTIAFDSARRKHKTFVGDLKKELDENCVGRRTAHRVQALVDRFDGKPGTDSPLEAKVAYRLSCSSLPPPVPQFHVIGRDGKEIARVDFAWIEQRVILECDSKAHHLNPVAWNKDLARRRKLEAEGFHVVHVTDAMLSNDDWLNDLGRMLSRNQPPFLA